MNRLGLLACVFAIGNLPAQVLESRSILTIKADGRCRISQTYLQSRAELEQQFRWVDYMKLLESVDDPTELPDPEEGGPPIPDDAFPEKLHGLWEMARTYCGESTTARVHVVEIDQDRVRWATQLEFPGVRELLQSPSLAGALMGLVPGDVRVDTEEEGKLRLSFYEQAAHHAQGIEEEALAELMVVLPGKIISSQFPQSATNATWILVDPGASERQRLSPGDGPIVVVAESGGLKLESPLNSSELRTTMPGVEQHEEEGEKIEIMEASPGFLVEPISLTTTVVALLSSNVPAAAASLEGAGLVLHLRVHAPKGLSLRSVSKARVLAARDDQGRALQISEEVGMPAMNMNYGTGREQQDPSFQPFELRLGLPSADARAVEHLEGELIAVTSGGWNDVEFPDVQEGAELSLAELLPDAKITIKQLKRQGIQLTMQAQLAGPSDIRQIQLQFKRASGQVLRGQTQERPSTSENQETREVSLFAYEAQGGEIAGGPITLVLRVPTTLKRERVRFTVTGLDLL